MGWGGGVWGEWFLISLPTKSPGSVELALQQLEPHGDWPRGHPPSLLDQQKHTHKAGPPLSIGTTTPGAQLLQATVR
jgi:hypothetical protein